MDGRWVLVKFVLRWGDVRAELAGPAEGGRLPGKSMQAHFSLHWRQKQCI